MGLTLVNFGYEASFAGLLGASMIIGGTIGSQITGNLLQSNGKFKIMLFSVCALSLFFAILVLMFIESKETNILMILFFLEGFFMISINAISYEFGVELTYPVEASISNGALNISSNLLSLIFTLLTSFIISISSDSPDIQK